MEHCTHLFDLSIPIREHVTKEITKAAPIIEEIVAEKGLTEKLSELTSSGCSPILGVVAGVCILVKEAFYLREMKVGSNASSAWGVAIYSWYMCIFQAETSDPELETLAEGSTEPVQWFKLGDQFAIVVGGDKIFRQNNMMDAFIYIYFAKALFMKSE